MKPVKWVEAASVAIGVQKLEKMREDDMGSGFLGLRLGFSWGRRGGERGFL